MSKVLFPEHSSYTLNKEVTKEMQIVFEETIFLFRNRVPFLLNVFLNLYVFEIESIL